MSIENELKHYGVLGMKWGVRRYQNKDGSLTPSGRKKQKLDKKKEEFKKASRKYKTEGIYRIPQKETTRNYIATRNEFLYAKEDLKSTNILENLKDVKKSEKQISLEKEYINKGMSKDEASVAAYQNINTKKILMAVGALTLTAAAGYAAYKFRDYRVDKIIKSGSILQNISEDSTRGIRDAFYSSKHGLDSIKYKGIYGDTLRKKGGTGKAFKKEIRAISDIRQASNKNAQDIFSKLLKEDPDFSKGVSDYMENGKVVSGNMIYMLKSISAKKELAAGSPGKNTYEIFNAALVDHSPDMQPLTDKFFKTLSDKGYNAIKDINDSKYSGYKALNPIIAFNTKGKVDVVDVKELAEKEVARAKTIGYADIIGKDVIKIGAMYTGIILGGNKIMTTGKQRSDQTKINEYRNDHPTTKKSNTEIIRMLEREELNNDA